MLGHPNYNLAFSLFVHEREGNAFGVLVQPHGGQHYPEGYYSQQLDLTAQSLPPCLIAVATTATLIKTTEKIIFESPSHCLCSPCSRVF